MVRYASYDAPRARALVPLLRAITQELQERDHATERLEHRLGVLRRRDGSDHDGSEAVSIRTQLSTHLHERRRAHGEIERLGCVLDEDHALRVLIPGHDGKFVHGYAWSPIDGVFQAVPH